MGLHSALALVMKKYSQDLGRTMFHLSFSPRGLASALLEAQAQVLVQSPYRVHACRCPEALTR